MTEEALNLSFLSCELNQALIARVGQLRDALVQIERSLQERHLSCCVFPQLQGAEEVASAIHQLSVSRIGALVAVERGCFSRRLFLFYPGPSPDYSPILIISCQKSF